MSINKLNNNSGVSMVEVVIGSILLAFVLSGSLLTFAHFADYERISNEKSMALRKAQSKLEEIKSTDDFDTITTTFNDQHYVMSPELNGAMYVSVTEMEAGNPNILRVRVSTAWSSGIGRVMGEGIADNDGSDGIIDTFVDANSDDIYESPVVLETYISKRF